jgi:hypothetical protein
MEDNSIPCNVIKTFLWIKATKRWGSSNIFKLQMALTQSCKKYQHVCVSNQIPQLLKGGIDYWGIG